MGKVESTKDCQKCWHLQRSGYEYQCTVVGRQTDGENPKQLCFYDDTYEANDNGTFNVTSTRTLDGETKIFKTRSAEIEWGKFTNNTTVRSLSLALIGYKSKEVG